MLSQTHLENHFFLSRLYTFGIEACFPMVILVLVESSTRRPPECILTTEYFRRANINPTPLPPLPCTC